MTAIRNVKRLIKWSKGRPRICGLAIIGNGFMVAKIKKCP
jgi:hypothetical protein